MTVVIVQSRLGSTRLPEKGLLDLAGKPVIVRVLETMKRVQADSYYLATDFDSYSRLAPVAAECGWECFAGSTDDVLSRFCRIAEKTDADIIVRATGDNPFLFYDAAEASVARFAELAGNGRIDYFTYSGLPHGSGVEVFNARTLLEAEKNTTASFDHEHVGPAFYNHTDKFNCVFETAPEKWNHPGERTTIDTPGDFRNAERIMYALKKAGKADSYDSGDIMAALNEPFVKNPVLLVPSVEAGHGTGHLRRCLELAKELFADIFVPDNATLSSAETLLREAMLEPFQIVRSLPVASKNEVRPFYSLIVVDVFALSESLASELWNLAPVVALDEGSAFTDYCDYLLDIIPSAVLERRANYKNSSFIPLPKNRKTRLASVSAATLSASSAASSASSAATSSGSSVTSSALEAALPEIRTALVCIGGEDPAGFTGACAEACRSCGLSVTEVTPEKPVANLREKLADYDLVVTHYGFTAFEASAAGCAVILVETTPLHRILSESEGFVCIPASALRDGARLRAVFSGLLAQSEVLYRGPAVDYTSTGEKSASTAEPPEDAGTSPLSAFVRHLSSGERLHCPICGRGDCGRGDKTPIPDEVVFRAKEKTYRECRRCGTLYLSWISAESQKYAESYFFEEYKNQYGKTYLEDFENIKAQGKRRMSHINKLAGLTGVAGVAESSGKAGAGDETVAACDEAVAAGRAEKKLLDIGCAYGPFLAAAAESGWEPYGIDVSESAVKYVNEALHFTAEKAPFPDGNFKNLPEKYDAVTMWYVIEHFKNLDSVIKKVSGLLSEGGVFAFSTPSASGVSARFSSDSFFKNSPKDHYSILDMRKCKKILKKYGFSNIKCVSTGHHPERFPFFCGDSSGKSNQKQGAFGASVCWKLISRISWIFKLGDTFELYCIKKG